MHRRRFLVAGALGTLAGCTGRGSGPGGTAGETPATDGGQGTPGSTPGVELPVPESDLRRGAAEDAIPAITDPVFGEDWSGIEIEAHDEFGGTYTASPRLQPDDPVIGVARGGEARAYPLALLNWHEVVNDALDGPLLVTYCPLCGSGVTAVRRVDGEETTFGVSGLLYRNDLVMYDERTESLWSQIMATAIRGPEAGETLEVVPSTFTTWGAWQDAHEDAAVLRPPPDSSTVRGPEATRDYTRNPYAGYENSRRIGLGGDYDDGRLHPKATVVGVEHGGVARAYPLQRAASAGVVNDEVGGLPVVVATAPGGSLVAYERRVGDGTPAFRRADERHLVAGGSRWEVATGAAVDGPHAGARLTQANDASPMFFFAWLDFHPDTSVYGRSG